VPFGRSTNLKSSKRQNRTSLNTRNRWPAYPRPQREITSQDGQWAERLEGGERPESVGRHGSADGAGSGIGKTMALALAAAGAAVVLTARTKSTLDRHTRRDPVRRRQRWALPAAVSDPRWGSRRVLILVRALPVGSNEK
jgi:hypothetical protein